MNSGDRHYMVDVETTGLVPAVHAVTSIAIVQFDPLGSALDFSQELSLVPQMYARILHEGPVVEDPQTREFRLEHGIDREENEIYIQLDAQQIRRYFENIVREDKESVYLWANSPSFDIEFIEYNFYYKKSSIARIPVPWSYRNILDVRTIKTFWMCAEAKDRIEQLTKDLLPHNARHDCFKQIIEVQSCLASHPLSR